MNYWKICQQGESLFLEFFFYSRRQENYSGGERGNVVRNRNSKTAGFDEKHIRRFAIMDWDQSYHKLLSLYGVVCVCVCVFTLLKIWDANASTSWIKLWSRVIVKLSFSCIRDSNRQAKSKDVIDFSQQILLDQPFLQAQEHCWRTRMPSSDFIAENEG